MKDRDFVYWLQGFFEMTNSTTLTPAQVEMIREHLALVFKKVTGKNTSNNCGTCGTAGNGKFFGQGLDGTFC